jgi:hypothetical protein
LEFWLSHWSQGPQPSLLSSGLSNSSCRSEPFHCKSFHLRTVRIWNNWPPFVDHHENLPTRSNNCCIQNHENCQIEPERIESKPTPLIVESFHIKRMPRSNEVEPNELDLMQKFQVREWRYSERTIPHRRPHEMKPPHPRRQKRFQGS